eukprot:104477_1
MVSRTLPEDLQLLLLLLTLLLDLLFGEVVLDVELELVLLDQRRIGGDVHTLAEHAVDAAREGKGVGDLETVLEVGSVEKNEEHVLSDLVVLVNLDALVDLVDEGVEVVDLHDTARLLAVLGLVTEGLSLDDVGHAGGDVVLAGRKDHGLGCLTLGDDNLGHVLAEEVLHPGEEGLVLLLALGVDSLLALALIGELHALLGQVDKLLAGEVGDVANNVLVDGVNHVDDLDVAVDGVLKDGALLDLLDVVTGEVEDALLVLGHAVNVLLEADELVLVLGGLVAEQLGEAGAVGAVLDHAEAQVLAELLPELGVGALLQLLGAGALLGGGLLLGLLLLVELLVALRDVVEHGKRLADELLLDDLEDAALLEDLAGHVQGEIVAVHNTLDEVEVAGEQVTELVGDEHTADVEADVGVGDRRVEDVVGGAAGDEKDRLELDLTLSGEVGVVHGILVVLREGLV